MHPDPFHCPTDETELDVYCNSITQQLRKAGPPSLDVVVYPNPFSDYLVVEGSFGQDENIQVEVYNMLGEMVFKDEARKSGSNTLDLTLLKPGFYLLQLGRSSYSKTISIIKI